MKRYTGGIRHDYKHTAVASSGSRRRHWLLFVAGASLPLIVVALLFLGAPRASAPIQSAEARLEPAKAVALAAPAPPPVPSVIAVPPLEPLADPEPIDVTSTMLDLLVKPGDTLEVLFRRNGLNLTDLASMVALPEAGSALKLLKPGDRLEIAHREGQVVSLRRELDEVKVLSIARGESGFAASTLERPVDIRTTGTHGVIRSSLFEAGTAAGMSDRVTMDMAGIFEWDIDFIQDVREGDQFTVIYEELWRDGVKLRDGEVIAAEFVNQGKVYRAARYTDGAGNVDYFTPEGRSLRKAFLRAPLNFTRISSNFNPNRRHPVLNTIRAHRGVDYAAPTGTPVEAAGDGRIITRGTKGGYGNTVEIDHGGDVTTLYGHLSSYARGQKVGTRVKQGEVIGYVGQSGLATGPHLHYEYRIQGVHKNPRTVPLPPAEPVPAQYLSDFQRVTAPLWKQLDSYRPATMTTAANTTAGGATTVATAAGAD